MQLACRQLGLTASISFSGVPIGNVNNGGVPAMNVTSATRRNFLDRLSVSAGADNPSQLALAQSMVMEVIYGAVLPESAMYFNYGNLIEGADFPLYRAANIGECLTSVHAGYVTNNMLRSEAIGLAGM